MLKWYYLDEFKSKDEYAKFIEYMLKNSDFFSVIYFRYNEQEPLKRSVKQIRDELRKSPLYNFTNDIPVGQPAVLWHSPTM